ncbi:MAG: bile acid:sodium symporter [Prevotellaceae bacterium]|nr:bile acid:sodium symporter [Candidatus Minthosoma equi]
MITVRKILTKLRENALITSMALGVGIYELFAHVEALEPAGDTLGPMMPDWLPVGLFTLLYFTFCKINLSEMKPRTWHFVIQLIRASISALMVGLICIFGDDPDVKLVLEGMFICFICPTASAVVVVAEKLGGSIGSLTTFTIIANMVTMIIIPTFFPMVEREANITFISAMLMLLRNIFVVLVVPLALALLSRRYIPEFVKRANSHKNIGFYIWCVNLAIISGVTMQNIAHSTVSGWVLWLLLITPLFVCLIQFAIGKAVGRHWNDSISAGQALGQKNTVIGVWLTFTFLNPLAAVAPGAYVLWQNLVNGWQIWYKEKHGKLIW